MRHFKVDGKDVLLNDTEAQYWVDTGHFKRIKEADTQDNDYCKLRDRMIANGDSDFYEYCCPKI